MIRQRCSLPSEMRRTEEFPLPSRVFGPETRVTNVLDTWVTLFGGYQRSNPTEIVRYKRFVKAVFH